MQLSSLSLALTRAGFLTQFSPASLFAANEPGVWYDPSDLTTMYQDAAGTTPVTAVEQPVGLILDKSRGLVLGPELVVNGDFAAGLTGWTNASSGTGSATVSGGAAVLIGTDSSNAARIQQGSTVAGKTYKVTFDLTVTSGTAVIEIGGSFRLFTTSGSRSYYEVALNAQGYVFRTPGGGGNFAIDNISVKELPGAHATQTTATSRPVLSARYNQLLKTEQFDDAGWSKSDVTVGPTQYTAPDGTLTAEKMVESPNNAGRGLFLGNPITLLAGQITWSVYLKAGERQYGGITAIDPGNNRYYLVANLLNGAEIASGASIGSPSLVSKSIESAGNGWYRLQITLISPAGSCNFGWVYPQNDSTFDTSPTGNAIYQGDGTSGIYIWGASLVPANQSALPYQRVNTATDYDTVGFPTYLKFDGIDDSLVTPTITPGTDKAQVFAGVRKLSDAANGTVLQFGDVFGSVGSLYVTSSQNNDASYGAGTSGGSGTNQTITKWLAYPAPISNVIASNLNNAGATASDQVQMRVNGVEGTRSGLTAGAGAGNFTAQTLQLCTRGSFNRFNGHLHSLIVRFGPTLTADQITQTETYVAGKTGVAL